MDLVREFGSFLFPFELHADAIARSQLQGDIMESEFTVPLVDESMAQALAPYLPEGQRSLEDLKTHLRSPQLQQTVTAQRARVLVC